MSAPQSPLIENQDFIVFGEDFARHPHSLEHLLRPLFSKNRFVWVETIGLRSPKFNVYDLKRIFEKLKGWFGPNTPSVSRVVPGNITIVSPLMIPLNQFLLVRVFNRWSVKRAVNKALKERQFKNVITVASVPNACDYVGEFGEVLKVFVCVDEFSLWPGLDYEMVHRMEGELLAKSDVVFATSQALVESKNNGRRPTILLTHGVDFKHFNIGAKKAASQPLTLCYFGLFDERSNQDILAEVAQGVPECRIQIIGKVVCDVKKLQSFANIEFTGPVSYDQLPGAIGNVDVFLLPYVRSELTNNLNPLKLKEYLSTGRPVIATALPEVVKLQDHLMIGSTGTDFVQLIRSLQRDEMRYDSSKTLQYLQHGETWDAKAALFSAEIRNAQA